MANRRTSSGGSFGSQPTPSPSPGPTSGSPRVSDFDTQVRSGGGGARVLDPDDPMVFLGPARLRPNEVTSDGAVVQRNRRPKAKPFSIALGEFYAWDDDERLKWGEYLAGLGLIDEDDVRDWDILKKMWVRFVTEAAEFSKAGKKAVSPWDVARKVAVEFGASDKEDEQFTGTKRFTRKQINLTSPEDAKGIVRAILRDQIGRAPTNEEFRAFIGVLNEAERANPQVTTATSEFVEGEEVSSSSVTTGGLGGDGIEELLMEEARSMPDYGAYQAATRLWNALIADVINSPV